MESSTLRALSDKVSVYLALVESSGETRDTGDRHEALTRNLHHLLTGVREAKIRGTRFGEVRTRNGGG